jgi:N-acetylneuraminate synthase
MDPEAWRDMVERTRELERALGSERKRVADNEMETVVIQRRCLRAARDLKAGETLSREMISVLRPAAAGAIQPFELEKAVGSEVLEDIPMGEALNWALLGRDDGS